MPTMPPELLPFLELLKSNSPMAVVASLALCGWWWERKRGAAREDHWFELAAAQIQTNTELKSALKALNERKRHRGEG